MEAATPLGTASWLDVVSVLDVVPVLEVVLVLEVLLKVVAVLEVVPVVDGACGKAFASKSIAAPVKSLVLIILEPLSAGCPSA